MKSRLEQYEFLPATRDQSRRGHAVDGIVMHYTGGGNGRAMARWIATDKNARVSWHFIVCRDGHVIQQVGLDRAAAHAGIGEWSHSSGETVSYVNSCTVGIEISNRGPLIATPDGLMYDSAGNLRRFGGNAKQVDGTFWEEYNKEQIGALEGLVAALVSEGVPERIYGHSEVAMPIGRKIDPGPLFPWERFRKAA